MASQDNGGWAWEGAEGHQAPSTPPLHSAWPQRTKRGSLYLTFGQAHPEITLPFATPSNRAVSPTPATAPRQRKASCLLLKAPSIPSVLSTNL